MLESPNTPHFPSINDVSEFTRKMVSFRERITRIEQRLATLPDSPKKAKGLTRLRVLKEKIKPRMRRAVIYASRYGGLDKVRIAAMFEMELAEVGSILRREGIFR